MSPCPSRTGTDLNGQCSSGLQHGVLHALGELGPGLQQDPQPLVIAK